MNKNSFLIIFLVLLSSCETRVNYDIYMEKNESNSVLETLDRCAKSTSCEFITLGDPYIYNVSSRLSIYTDSITDDWVIVSELMGYHNRTLEAVIKLNYFGNSVNSLPNNEFGISNINLISLIGLNELERIQGEFECISKTANFVKIRNEDVMLEHNLKNYHNNNIFSSFDENSEIDFIMMLRLLNLTNPDILRATDEEKRKFIPSNLKKLIVIDDWNHTDYSPWDGTGKLPSEQESYQIIAELIQFHNPQLWSKFSGKSNNRWVNWLHSGGM